MSRISANPRSISHWLIHKFCAGGVEEISRWFPPSVSTQIRHLIFVPEGHQTLAGGGAQRNHRNSPKPISRPGRDAGPGFAAESMLVLRPSRARSPLLWRFRWLRCAPPPANVRCASGAKNCVDALRWRRGLTSVASPALKNLPSRLLARAHLGLFAALLLAVFSASCRQDMQDQPKYKPLAPSSFFSDGKSARQLVDGTEPYSPEGRATPTAADLSKMTTPPFALT